MSKTLSEIVREALATNASDSSVVAPPDQLVRQWRDTYSVVSNRSEQSLLRFVFVAFLFVLINSAQIKKANLFGIELDNLQIVAILAYLLAALFIYQFI